MRLLLPVCFALACACGSRDEPELEDLPVVELDEGTTRPAPTPETAPTEVVPLREDARPWTRGTLTEGRVLLEGGHFTVREAGGTPPRLRVGRAASDLGDLEGELLVDPADGRVLADVPELGRWMPSAGVFFPPEPPADGVFTLRRALDGQTFTVTVHPPGGVQIAAHPDADRVWFRGADGDGTVRVARLEALEDATVTLASALPAAPGLARYDAEAHTFAVVTPGGRGTCAVARFGEEGCLRRGPWEGGGGMAEIPLADGWLLVDQEAIGRATEDGAAATTSLRAGCPGFSLIGALSEPPRVAYQCLEATPPVVRAWSPERSIEVDYPARREAARFMPLDLRVPVLMGPGFAIEEPRRSWIDLRRMRALEGPPLLSIDDLLDPEERYVGVRPEGGLVLVDLGETTFSPLGQLPCDGGWEVVARGGGRIAVRCTANGESRGAVVLDPARHALWTTDRRVEAVLPDGTVIGSGRRADAGERAARLFVLEPG